MSGSAKPPEESQSLHAGWLFGPALALATAAECLAGAYVAGSPLLQPRALLTALCAAGLFAAGSAMGHYADRRDDGKHFPLRPLSAGRASPGMAWGGGWTLLLLSLGGCWAVGQVTGALGTVVAILVVLYATVARRIWGLGHLALGMSRATTLLMGAASADNGLQWAVLPAVSVGLYAAGWAVARGSLERRAPRSAGFIALVHVAAALVAQCSCCSETSPIAWTQRRS